MVYDAERYVRNANAATRNEPGMCLMTVRQWAGIEALYGTAAEAWAHTKHRIAGTPPVGSTVWWTGGSSGAGHIATLIAPGKVRSTDAGGAGRVTTVDLHWPETHWGLRWAGCSWDINGVVVPHDSTRPDPIPAPNDPGNALDLKILNDAVTGALQ